MVGIIENLGPERITELMNLTTEGHAIAHDGSFLWWVNPAGNFIRFVEDSKNSARLRMWNQEGRALSLRDADNKLTYEKTITGNELKRYLEEIGRRKKHGKGLVVLEPRAEAQEIHPFEEKSEKRKRPTAAESTGAKVKGIDPRPIVEYLRGINERSGVNFGRVGNKLYSRTVPSHQAKEHLIFEIEFTDHGRNGILRVYNQDTGGFVRGRMLINPEAVGNALESVFSIEPHKIQEIPLLERDAMGFRLHRWSPDEKRKFGLKHPRPR